MFRQFENDNPARDALLSLGTVVTIIAIVFIIHKVKPSWIVTDHQAIHEKYLREKIEPMQLRARIVKKHLVEFDRKHFDGLQLNDRGEIRDLLTGATSIALLYSYAQVNDSILKEKGTRVFILVHKGVKTEFVFE